MKKNTSIIGTVQSIPVSALSLSEKNVRKTGGQSIDDLAASIKAQGLIQNLTVMPINGSGRYEVVAGGRRWRALRSLIKAKALPKDHEVPCKIVSEHEAEEISLAENVIREAMQPADQFEAFKGLIDKGQPIEDVAARFGVTPLLVKQRLKLANVSPALIAQFREKEVTLEQMMALAVTDDHAAQERVWSAARQPWQREPQELRGALTETDVDASRDRRAKYIGVAAYEKAGGAVRRDLFSDAVYLGDVALLDKLTEEKLARAAVRVQKEGWGWVEQRIQCDYSELHSFGRLALSLRNPTKKEQSEIDALNKEQVALEQEYQEEISEERSDELDLAVRLIEERLAEIEQARRVDDAEAKAAAGALVFLGNDGSAHIERGLVRSEDCKALRAQQPQNADDIESSNDSKAEKAEFSDALTRRLTAERTQALRASFAKQPAHALTALVHALVLAQFYDDPATALDITVRDEAHLQRTGGDLDQTKAGQALHALRCELQMALPSDAADLWAWMIEQDQATQLTYLAYCLAPAVNAVQDRSSNSHTQTRRPIAASHALAALLHFDMADWWLATQENYFGAVSKVRLIEAVRETKGDEVAARLEKMKKGDAVAAASNALDGTRWLPSILRRR
jgi:ParB family transcriptional regulator, chromosome partitioning protein